MGRGKPEKYLALAETVREFIREQRFKNGTPLPSERKMAAHFEVNHLTLRKALALLEKEGLIHKIPSRGNYVGRKPAARRHSGLIGLIIPEEDVFFFEVLTELEKKMDVFGYHPIVNISHDSVEKEKKCLRYYEKIGVEALIAVPNPSCGADYQNLNIPCVFFDVFINQLEIPYVVVDDYEGSGKAIDHLVSLGHQHIAHIGGKGDETSLRRCEGYTDALKRHGLKANPKHIKLRDYSRQWGYYAIQELLSESEVPTAVFCGNDTIAAGVLRYLDSQKISCPGKVSVIGFGNTFLAESMNLSTIDQSVTKIASATWANLHNRLKGEKPALKTIINTELIIRESTGQPETRP